MKHLLAQLSFDDIESYLFLVVIALSVLGQVANSWIKSIKEKKEAKKERERRLRTGRDDIVPQEPAFPVAKPRSQSPPVARPTPPTAKPRGPVVSQSRPPKPKRDHARPRIPDSIPDPIREFLGELLPEFTGDADDRRPQPESVRQPKPQPKKRTSSSGKKREPQRLQTTLKPEAPRGALSPAPPIDATIDLPGDEIDEVADRLGMLTSEIGAGVDANLGRLESDPGSHYAILGQPMGHEHGYADYAAPHARFTPDALKQAVVYFEIFSKPKAIREEIEVDPF